MAKAAIAPIGTRTASKAPNGNSGVGTVIFVVGDIGDVVELEQVHVLPLGPSDEPGVVVTEVVPAELPELEVVVVGGGACGVVVVGEFELAETPLPAKNIEPTRTRIRAAATVATIIIGFRFFIFARDIDCAHISVIHM
jgi:hypothetical protein